MICFLLCFCFLYFFVFSHGLSASALTHLVVDSFLSFLSRLKYDTTNEESMASQLQLTYRPTRARTLCLNFFHYESLRRVCRHFCLNRRHPSFRLSILFLIFRNICPVRCNRIYTIVECLSMPPKERKKKRNKNLKNFNSAKFSKKTYLNRIF